MNKKLTHRDYFYRLYSIIKRTNVEDKEELLEFIRGRLKYLDSKDYSNNKMYVLNHVIKGDEVREAVYSVLSFDYWKDIDLILEQISDLLDEEITRNKVRHRLDQLIKLKAVKKEKHHLPGRGKNKIMEYKLIPYRQ